MKQIAKISKRIELPQRYDRNQKINLAIKQAFADSVAEFVAPMDTYVLPAYIPPISKYDDEYHEYEKGTTTTCGELPYNSTTIKDGGCAVCCFKQGLAVQGYPTDLKDLADILGKKGYYEPGKGTWHQLFDHWGLRRATHYAEVFEALDRGTIVTALVRNIDYPGNNLETGKNFINIVGAGTDYIEQLDKEKENTFYVDDPAIGRIEFFAKDILKAIEFAWIW